MEPAVHQSLTEMLDYEGDDFDQVFCLNFQTQVQDFEGKTQLIDLITDGGEVGMRETFYVCVDGIKGKATRQWQGFVRFLLLIMKCFNFS